MNHLNRTVAEAGEDAVLEVLLEVTQAHNATVENSALMIGPGGDDAAVFSSAGAGLTVYSTDTMSEGQDFRRRWWSNQRDKEALTDTQEQQCGRDVGIKAAAQNLSDINAMGAEPTAVLISLTLPGWTTLNWVQGFFHGVVQACRAQGSERCVVAGGDLGSGENISVSITAIGEVVAGEKPLTRSGAVADQILAVSGNLGRGAAGLALLEAGVDTTAVAADHSGLLAGCVDAQLRPQPPLCAGRAAVAAGASAGMDISDGLLRDAQRLAKASGVRISLDEQSMSAVAQELEPVASQLGLGQDAAWEWVSSGGEEYALLAVFPRPAQLPEGFFPIGETYEADGEPGVVVPERVRDTGWDSLRDQ